MQDLVVGPLQGQHRTDVVDGHQHPLQLHHQHQQQPGMVIDMDTPVAQLAAEVLEGEVEAQQVLQAEGMVHNQCMQRWAVDHGGVEEEEEVELHMVDVVGVVGVEGVEGVGSTRRGGQMLQWHEVAPKFSASAVVGVALANYK